MSYPPTKPDATFFDADNDKISESRAELKTAVDAINTVVDTIDTTGITTGQTLVWNGTKFTAGTAGGDRSSYGTRQDLGTITSGGTYNLNMTGDFAYIGFNVSTGTTVVNISVPQDFDTEYTIVAHRYSTDGGTGSHTVTINIIDTNDSAGGYTYNAQGAGAVGTKIFFSKLTSSEAGRTLYMIDNLSIDSSA